MNEDIGKVIAEKRKELGWSQDELAKKMGYTSRSTINKIELGINDVSTTKAKKFSKVLGCSLKELMGWEKAPEEVKQDAAFHARILRDQELLEALKVYYKLPDVQQKIVIDLIYSLGK